MIRVEDLKNKPIIIYGAGSGLNTFSVVLGKYNITPVLILDAKNNIDDYFPTEKEKDYLVIITVGKEEYHGAILKYLKCKGFKNIIFYYDVYEAHVIYRDQEINFDHYHFQVRDALASLSDSESIDVFLSIFKIYTTKELHEIKHHSIDQQYYPRDIVIDYSRIIHCGAYSSNSVVWNRQTKELILFEPDPSNYSALVCTKNKSIRTTVIPCAVYDYEQQIAFQDGNGTNSNVNPAGTATVQCVAIDHIIPDFKPTYIVMDIEGAEINALKGCKETITKYKPALAIAVYHKPNHLWEIINLIYSYNPEYKFYIRNYTGFVAETVLYAVTKGKTA